MDYKLEVVVVPVSDVDRAKAFYQRLGWRLDADFVTGPDFRVVQVTPPAFDSVAGLAEALRRAADAHGKHEEEIGRADPDWPDWYARYVVDESVRQDAAAAGPPVPVTGGLS
jgi:catechol 2,3-dioxygenase-like lactoylglutathione lyase family enzyme